MSFPGGGVISGNRSLPEGVPNFFQTWDLGGGYVPGYKGPGIQRDTIGKHTVRTLLECFLVQTDFAWVVTDLAQNYWCLAWKYYKC